MYSYEHGGNIRFKPGTEHILDFSANINPLGLPCGVAEAIQQEISAIPFYPDTLSTALREEIAVFEGIAPNHIICTNGASEAIFRLALAIKPRKALVLAPTFSDYRRALSAVGAVTDGYYLAEERAFGVDEGLLHTVKQGGYDLLFLCNPNNPTGVVAEPQLLAKLAECCQHNGTVLAVDECFLDFVADADKLTAKALLPGNDHLIILKAFTKTFALPGLRLGYALCANERLLAAMYAHGPDWSVSNIAQSAGIAALRAAPDYLTRTRSFLTEEKAYLLRNLNTWGYITYSSSANFIFFKDPNANDLQERLQEQGIYIRSCSNFEGLSAHFFRIGISTKENNRLLPEAIRKATEVRR